MTKGCLGRAEQVPGNGKVPLCRRCWAVGSAEGLDAGRQRQRDGQRRRKKETDRERGGRGKEGRTLRHLTRKLSEARCPLPAVDRPAAGGWAHVIPGRRLFWPLDGHVASTRGTFRSAHIKGGAGGSHRHVPSRPPSLFEVRAEMTRCPSNSF